MHKAESWRVLGAVGMFVVLLCGLEVHNCMSTYRIRIKSEMNIYNSPHLLGTYLR